MSEQPTALRLADALKKRKATHHTYSGTGRISLVTGNSADPLCRDAAAELRRLHAENVLLHERHHFDNGVLKELLEALKYHQEQTRPIERTRAAIAKAEGEV
jgi:hypothetical protein